MDRRRFLLAAGAWAVAGGCAAAGRRSGRAAPDAAHAAVPDAGAFASLAGFCEGVRPPGADDFRRRRARLAEALRRFGWGAWVGEPGADVAYLWGARLRTSERPILCVVRADGRAAWVVPAFERDRLERLAGPDTDLVGWSENMDPFGAAGAVLSPAEPTVLAPAMRLWVADGLTDALRGRTLTRRDPVGEARIVKDPVERALLERANEATKAALDAVAPRLAPGMRTSEVAALVRAAQEAAGLSDVWVLALAGPDAALPHGGAGDGIVREGAPLLVDTGGALHGYRSDVTRTFVLGRPGPGVARAYETVLRAQRAALDRVRAGEHADVPDAVARDVIEKAGYPGGFGAMTHRLGHGIGLEGHEPPYLVGRARGRLPAGATVSVEPGIYLPGRFGVRIEDIVEIRDGAPKVYGPLADPL